MSLKKPTEDDKLKDVFKILDFMNANSDIGEVPSYDNEFEGGESSGPRVSGYSPAYMEAVKQKQMAAVPDVSEAQKTAEDVSKAGSLMTATGSVPSPATPYLVGAGLGLKALGMVQQGKEARRQEKYRAELAKANARQNAISNLASLSARLQA